MRSENYENWITTVDERTCKPCFDNWGKIYLAEEPIIPDPPLHPRCRCRIEWMDALLAGTATNELVFGADYWLKWLGQLPYYYITLQDAKALGYIPWLGNLSIVAPGKMIAKGVYKNKNGHLPSKDGRVWFEADINYYWGYRGSERILFSNDGLIFVTYDHYHTFHEIV